MVSGRTPSYLIASAVSALCRACSQTELFRSKLPLRATCSGPARRDRPSHAAGFRTQPPPSPTPVINAGDALAFVPTGQSGSRLPTRPLRADWRRASRDGRFRGAGDTSFRREAGLWRSRSRLAGHHLFGQSRADRGTGSVAWCGESGRECEDAADCVSRRTRRWRPCSCPNKALQCILPRGRARSVPVLFLLYRVLTNSMGAVRGEV